MEIKKIVITGGPCAGKTTGMNSIKKAFSQKGYTVLFVPETATELILGGVAPWTCGTNGEYQKVQVKLQLTKEDLFDYAARTMKEEKILIVCDRAALDNKAYMNDEEYQAALDFNNTNEAELLSRYDAVFHLVTAAKGIENVYSFENNAARYETVDEAVALDNRLIASWDGHPYHRIIDSKQGFEEKMQNLIDEIAAFLHEDSLKVDINE